jgi:hypothetical protein
MKNRQLQQKIIDRLINKFEFKEKTDFLRYGRCPECGKKELFTPIAYPRFIKCGRLNNCGYEGDTKDIFKDLYEKLNEKYKPTQQNPNATADAYMELERGFNPRPLKGAYRQGSFYSHYAKKGTATVLFDIDRANAISMERFVETIYEPQEDGSLEPRKQNFNGSFRGLFWNNPLQTIKPDDTVYITEACLDAIALQQNGYKAVAALTSSNYPIKDIEKHDPDKTVNWVLALDGDKAGRDGVRKHYKLLVKAGYSVRAAIPPMGSEKEDWNDLHEKEKITPKHMKEYHYQGDLLVAKSATDKALLIHYKEEINNFPLDFANHTYWFKLDLDKLSKALERLNESEEHQDKPDKEKRNIAISQCGSLSEMANCKVSFLYFQRNELTDESWYYARVEFPHFGKPIKLTFSNSQILAASRFAERLLVAPGAVFEGNSSQLTRLVKPQIFNIKTVDTIDFIGYSKDHNAYLFNDKAVSNGRVININDEDYFELGSLSIKSLSRSPELMIAPSHKYKSDWFNKVWECFGAKGLAALTFWFGSLFAEQIRKAQDSYPFLELVGEPGAGKSTLIEFMWRLFGRADWEGFDPSKATAAARARNMSQVSNLPVVMLEGDRDDDISGSKSMDWDEFKTAYNGRATRSRGLKNSGNETYEPPFRGSIVISQNADVSASEAILQRIVHITFTREGHTENSKIAADWLSRADVSEVSYFLIKATLAEEKVMKIVKENQPRYEKKLLAKPEIKTVRIAKNHAQLMALVDALTEVIELSKEQRDQTIVELSQMAIDRQNAIGSDHPIVAQFWETFYYLNESAATQRNIATQEAYEQKKKAANGESFSLDQQVANDKAEFETTYIPGLDHSKNKEVVAVSLQEFVTVGGDHKQQIPLLIDLKKLLKGSRSHKFIGVKTVLSAITSKSKKCWVFKKPIGGHHG